MARMILLTTAKVKSAASNNLKVNTARSDVQWVAGREPCSRGRTQFRASRSGPDDSVLISDQTGSSEIYALDLEWP